MALLGPSDLKQFALPTGWDSSELLKYSLADGTTFDTVVNDIVAALTLKTQQLLSDPIYGGMVTVTEEQGKEYRDGSGSGGMNDRSEYTKPDSKRGKTIGHMFPLKSKDRGLGFTWDFLRKARRSQIEASIEDALYDVEDSWQRDMLTRFFSTTENLLGSSGYDVPFVKGTGSVAFTPPPWMGQTFASSHTHFDRQTDDAAGYAAALEAGAAHLWEHGLRGPWIGLVPFGDKANFTALANFVKPDLGLQYIQAASSSTLTVGKMGDEFFGLYETALGLIQLHATNRLPANYFGMYKSFGLDNMRNPLAMRVSPDLKASPIVRTEKSYPLQEAILIHEYGIGINDRLNGYACEFDASGSYAAPTIS